MKRREFAKTCGNLCLGTLIPGFVMSCGISKTIAGTLDGNYLVIDASALDISPSGNAQTPPKIVATHESLKHPVLVVRINENEYSAVWLQCPHQGAELQVFGERLQCPAHGSEFLLTGDVMTGPAETNLRKFPVLKDGVKLKIYLGKEETSGGIK